MNNISEKINECHRLLRDMQPLADQQGKHGDYALVLCRLLEEIKGAYIRLESNHAQQQSRLHQLQTDMETIFVTAEESRTARDM